MPNLEFSIVFEVPPKVIYNALVDQYEVAQYTRAPCVVENQEGGKYSILDGRIEGVFEKLAVGLEIVMKWRFNDWKEYSTVTLRFIDRDDSCELKVSQVNIPAGHDLGKLEHGWKNQIFIPMSKIRGYPIENDD